MGLVSGLFTLGWKLALFSTKEISNSKLCISYFLDYLRHIEILSSWLISFFKLHFILTINKALVVCLPLLEVVFGVCYFLDKVWHKLCSLMSMCLYTAILSAHDGSRNLLAPWCMGLRLMCAPLHANINGSPVLSSGAFNQMQTFASAKSSPTQTVCIHAIFKLLQLHLLTFDILAGFIIIAYLFLS